MTCHSYICEEPTEFMVIAGCLDGHIHEYQYCVKHARTLIGCFCESEPCMLYYEQSCTLYLPTMELLKKSEYPDG